MHVPLGMDLASLTNDANAHRTAQTIRNIAAGKLELLVNNAGSYAGARGWWCSRQRLEWLWDAKRTLAERLNSNFECRQSGCPLLHCV